MIHLLGYLNEHVILPRVLRVRQIDFPAEDFSRLRGAVHGDTAAFLTPNHPEFFTDWMVDKAISMRCSPMMAHWAAPDVVNASPLAQKFWLANHLIAAAPRGGGKPYSHKVARAGHGVLLHPEGKVTWQGRYILPLRRGAANMALDLARQLDDEHDPRPVFLVPVVWRYRFLRDASDGLQRERALIERESDQRVDLGGTTTQEDVAEVLKATRAKHVRKGWRNMLHNVVPRAVAPRAVHIRVPEPIDVREAHRRGISDVDLTELLRDRMQTSLSGLIAELDAISRSASR
jgi:hypothetical protein